MQGDIFFGVPRLDLSLAALSCSDAEGSKIERRDWMDIVKEAKPVTVLSAVRPVPAIVISQDCDASRSPDLTLCEIRDFREVERNAKDTKSDASWVKILTQYSRLNQKWFYLPPDPNLGFSDKMAVDFMVTIRVSREDLELRRGLLRKGRLIHMAREHFRERVGEFFRRFAYDEWYALNKKELEEYQKKHPDTLPFGWQK